MKNSHILCFGEILWDLLPDGKTIGGAPFNVAYHLHTLGADTSLISKIGTDPRGDEIKYFLHKKNLNMTLLQETPLHPTGIVQTKTEEKEETSYDIIKEVAWDFIDYTEQVEQQALKSGYLVFGTLACRHSVSRHTLMQLIKTNPHLIKVLDVNLRPPFYSKDLVRDLLVQADMVKMNERELFSVSDWLGGDGDGGQRIRYLTRRFQLQTLIVTMGAQGAYVWDNGTLYNEESSPVTVIDTIGSGDAFLAGYLTRHIQRQTPPEALRFANKMGAFIAQQAGGCPDYTPEEVE